MATRTTQLRILQAALELFNEHGTAAVSANRIAEYCGISKGNLQYHYRNKREIIYSVFQQAINEMDSSWYRDHLTPTLEHMAGMFVRQLQLILNWQTCCARIACCAGALPITVRAAWKRWSFSWMRCPSGDS